MRMNCSSGMVLLTALTLLSLGNAWADDDFVDQASPKKTIYCPVSTNSKAIGQTIPLKQYTFLEETPRGYIVILDKASFSPPLGFIQKVTRLGNSTAKYHGGGVEILPMVNEPIFPGYIPFVQGKSYPILRKEGNNLRLLYSSPLAVATGVVSAADCSIVSAAMIRKERDHQRIEEERQQLERRGVDIEAAIAKSISARSYAEGLLPIKQVIAAYPTHPSIRQAKERLAMMESSDYRTVAEAIDRAQSTIEPSTSADLIQKTIATCPKSPLRAKAEELVRKYQSQDVAAALARSAKVDTQEEAIRILSVAIDRSPLATNLSDAKQRVDSLQQELQALKEMTPEQQLALNAIDPDIQSLGNIMGKGLSAMVAQYGKESQSIAWDEDGIVNPSDDPMFANCYLFIRDKLPTVRAYMNRNGTFVALGYHKRDRLTRKDLSDFQRLFSGDSQWNTNWVIASGSTNLVSNVVAPNTQVKALYRADGKYVLAVNQNQTAMFVIPFVSPADAEQEAKNFKEIDTVREEQRQRQRAAERERMKTFVGTIQTEPYYIGRFTDHDAAWAMSEQLSRDNSGMRGALLEQSINFGQTIVAPIAVLYKYKPVPDPNDSRYWLVVPFLRGSKSIDLYDVMQDLGY